MMPKLLDPETEGRVRALSGLNWSSHRISKRLKDEGILVSPSTCLRVIKGVGKRREARARGEQFKHTRCRPKCTPAVLRRVRDLASRANPSSHSAMAQAVRLSKTRINQVIHKDLGLVSRKKPRLHALTDQQRQNRATNARKLYEQVLAGDRSEFVVTLDEAMIHLNDVCSQTRSSTEREDRSCRRST